jgi:hypothetical protein
MVPASSPYTTTPPMAGTPVLPPQAVYNPTPPVKPVAKKSTGCMGVLLVALGLAPLVWVLVALTAH